MDLINMEGVEGDTPTIEAVAKAIYKVDGEKGWHLHSKFYLDSASAVIGVLRQRGYLTPEAIEQLRRESPSDTGRTE